jgi:uncharacterized protein YkuJ
MNNNKSTVKFNKTLSRYEIVFYENNEDPALSSKKKKRKSIHDSIDLINNLIGKIKLNSLKIIYISFF